MNILIIEDESRAAKRLEHQIRRVLQEFSVTPFFYEPLDSVSSSITFFETTPNVDLIFLDIHLADGISFEILEKVHVEVPVIFTTAFDEYAIKSFKVHSIDYLLKPIDEKHLETAIRKFFSLTSVFGSRSSEELYLPTKIENGMAERLSDLLTTLSTSGNIGYKSRFLVQTAQGMMSIPTIDIAYFYSEHKVSWLFSVEGKKYAVDYTLEQLQTFLEPRDFFRVNRQCIVHIQSVKRINTGFNGKLIVTLLPSTSEEIIVGREKASSFKEWLDR